MPQIPPVSPDVDLLEALRHEILVRKFYSAAGALFAYDVLTNFDLELECIWAVFNPRKRPVKIAPVLFSLVYLIQRYLPLFDQIILDQYFMLGAHTNRACMITYAMCAWISLAGISLSEIILVIRIWAVWSWNSWIGVILAVFSVGGAIPGMFFLARFVEGIQYPELNIPGDQAHLQRCFYVMKNKDVVVPWILLMVYDMVGFILMAIPGFKAYRTGGSSNLLKVIYRDGVIYYALIFMVSLINVIVILILPPDLGLLLSGLERVLHSILASHAILHIRKVATKDYIQMRSMSNGMMTGELTSQGSIGTEILFAPNMFQSGVEWAEDQKQTRD